MNELTTSRYRRERDEARKATRIWQTVTAAAVISSAAVCILAGARTNEAAKAIEAAEAMEPEVIVLETEPAAGEPTAADPMQAEKEALARMVWGEARGCDLKGQQDVVWTALARYDHGGYGDTLLDVVTAPMQFQGYAESNPVEPEILEVVDGVVAQWLDGNPGPGWLYFEGDGTENHFRKEWLAGGEP